MILPRGRPATIAIDVPATTILIASERNSSGTNLTAMGVAIDQNTECAHATPIRDNNKIIKVGDIADKIWDIPKNTIQLSKSFL